MTRDQNQVPCGNWVYSTASPLLKEAERSGLGTRGTRRLLILQASRQVSTRQSRAMTGNGMVSLWLQAGTLKSSTQDLVLHGRVRESQEGTTQLTEGVTQEKREQTANTQTHPLMTSVAESQAMRKLN